MKLQIALLNPSLEWQLVLEQEQPAYTVIDLSLENLDRNEYPVVVVPKRTANLNELVLKKFIEQGGVIVTDQNPILQNWNYPGIIKLNFDLKAKLYDQSYCDKEFVLNGTSVIETVSKVNKAEIRRQAIGALRNAFWKQNLPYAHLWYFPESYLSVFNFRLDLDEYDPTDFETTCKIIEKHSDWVSCFPCMKTYEGLDSPLQRLVEMHVEMGSHGYVHHVYHSKRQNRLNLESAEKILGCYVHEIKAFAGPHGKWHPTLQEALEERHYIYSSEFGLDYNDFPFYPFLKDRFSTVLQIPTHPICEGVFLQRYAFDEKMFRDYYDTVAEYKMHVSEPIFIFGHSTRRIGRYPKILTNLFDSVDRQPKIWKTNLNSFAKWWQLRNQTCLSFRLEEKVIYSSSVDSGRVSVEIILPNQTRSILPASKLKDGIALNLLSNEPFVLVSDPVQERSVQYGPWKILRKWLKRKLDWETKTPLQILQINHPVDALKWGMRMIHDLMKGAR